MRVCLNCDREVESPSWGCGVCGWEPRRINGFLAFAPDLETSTLNYPVGGHEEIHDLEDGNFWFEGRNRLILWAIRRYFTQVSRFLEIGCGTGFVLRAIQGAFASAEISGSEISVSGLTLASNRVGQAVLIQMDARRIPFRNHFDLIGAFDVLEHIEEDEAALVGIHAALSPGGGLLLTVPQHRWLWSPVDDFAGHARRYTRKEMVAKLESSGFEILMATSFVTGLLPFMFLSRFAARHREGAKPELHPGGIQNTIGTLMASVELLLIRGGLRFPVGGSLLVAARRKD